MPNLSEKEEKIARRQDLFEKTFESLKEEMGESLSCVRLNAIVLHNVVVSYFDDVERYKSYHEAPRANEIKQAGFTIKWLIKLRPIEFLTDFTNANSSLLYANELYALRYGLAFLEISPDQIDRELYCEILYTLHYRSIDEGMLFVWLRTLQLALAKDIC